MKQSVGCLDGKGFFLSSFAHSNALGQKYVRNRIMENPANLRNHQLPPPLLGGGILYYYGTVSKKEAEMVSKEEDPSQDQKLGTGSSISALHTNFLTKSCHNVVCLHAWVYKWITKSPFLYNVFSLISNV